MPFSKARAKQTHDYATIKTSVNHFAQQQLKLGFVGDCLLQ